METIDAIVRARKMKLTLDTRVVGKCLILQDKSFASLVNSKRGIFTFDIVFSHKTAANMNAIKQTIKSFKGHFISLSVAENNDYKIKFNFKGE